MTLSIACDSLRCCHGALRRGLNDGKFCLFDLTDGKPGIWIGLRPDRGVPVDANTAIEYGGLIHESRSNPANFVDGFLDFPHSLLVFKSSEPEKVPYVFLKSNVISPGDVYVRLSHEIPFKLHPNDKFRFGPGRANATTFEFLRFNTGTGSAQGIRPTMEDEEVVIDDLVIDHHPELLVSWYGCYDGHGSNECSRYLSKNLHKIFQSHFPSGSMLSVQNIASSFVRTFIAADDEFSLFAKQRGISQNVGSVVVVVCVIGGIIFCANLGDARAILGRSDGSVLGLSQDMKPTVPSELDRIKKCGGQVINNRVNGRLAVSRAIGDMEFKPTGIVSNIPEVRAVEMRDDDEFLLLACDGLFDVMSSEEVANFVRSRVATFVEKNEEPNPRQIAVDLVTESIMKRNTSDNVTVMIIFLKKFCTS